MGEGEGEGGGGEALESHSAIVCEYQHQRRSPGGKPPPVTAGESCAPPPLPTSLSFFLLSIRSYRTGLFQISLFGFGTHVVPAVYQALFGVLCVYQPAEPCRQSQLWTPFHRETAETQRVSVTSQGHTAWPWESQTGTAPAGLYLSGRVCVCLSLLLPCPVLTPGTVVTTAGTHSVNVCQVTFMTSQGLITSPLQRGN